MKMMIKILVVASKNLVATERARNLERTVENLIVGVDV
jgi:hypothetical protein